MTVEVLVARNWKRLAVAVASTIGLLAAVLALNPGDASALTLGTSQILTVNGIHHDGRVIGISCTPAVGAAPAGCVGVGTNEGNQKPLVVIGDGATQTASYADADTGRHLLQDVWCASTARCVAVGWADGATGNHQYIMEYSSGTWTRVAAIDPPHWSAVSGGIRLAEISCTDIDNCVAVGWFQADGTATPANSVRPIAYSKIGGTWSYQVVEPTGATFSAYTNPPTSRFTSVRCVSATKCIAAGTYGTTSGQALLPFAAVGTVSGGVMTWTTTSVPIGDLAAFSYGDVPLLDCSSANYCVVAGNYDGPSSTPKNFYWAYANGSWAANATVSDLDPTDHNYVYGIDCPSDGLCFIVGANASWSHGSLITLTNGTPAFQVLDRPGDTAISGLTAITCVNAYSCAIAGAGSTDGRWHTTIGSLENGVWSMYPTYAAIPSEWESDISGSNAIDCRADGQCWMGTAANSSNETKATLTDFTITVTNGGGGSSSTTTTTIGSSTTTAPGSPDLRGVEPTSGSTDPTTVGDPVAPAYTG